LIEASEARQHEALRSDLAARELLVGTHEASNISGVESNLATTYRELGDTENDWVHQLLALRAAAAGSSSDRRNFALMNLATAAIGLRRFRLADLLLDRIEREAGRQRDPRFQASVLQERSRIFVARHNPRRAMQQLDRAAALVAAAPPNPAMAQLAGEIALARGEVMTSYDPAGAIELLLFARRRLEELRLRDRRARISLLMGKARQAAGDPAGAEAEFLAGIDEVEQQRSQMGSDEDRSTFTDTARSLFDGAIDLLVRRDAVREALTVVRRARAAVQTADGTAQALPRHEFHPSTAGNRGSTLPPSSLLLEYYVLPDAVMIWATGRGQTRMVRRPIDADALAARVSSHARRIAQCAEASDCLASSVDLFDLLLRPLGTALSSSQDVIVAPDAVLHYVPFAALYDREAGTYLIEDHTVTLALGSGVTPHRSPFRSILIAAAPSPGEGLATLRAVEQEARSAARTFGTSLVLTGGEATAPAMLAAAGDYEIFHFAGHAVWNERRPQLAALRLAPDGAHSDGSLYAREVTGQRFRKTRLVVLAGCDTARGRPAGVGLLSFTRTFLAAGVPEAIGSLWPVGDEESARFFGTFYCALARDPSPAAALRQAQRDAMIREGPSAWATYQLYDGGTD
jgi:CHAT domain-containing protein